MDFDCGTGGGTGSARRRRERRLRMHWRHEQLSLRMALVTASHHSFDRVHVEYAAPRRQRTGNRAGEGEVFESREAPRGQHTPHPGKRPAPLLEVRLQGQLERHTGSGLSWCSTPSCHRWRNSWWKLLTFHFKKVLGFVEVFTAQAQDRVCQCRWSTSHSRQLCSCRQRLWWSTLHPRQRCSFQWWTLLHPHQHVFQARVPPAEYLAPAPVEKFVPAPVVIPSPAPVEEHISPAYCAPVPVVSQPPAPVDDFISPAPAVVQLATPVSEYISPASAPAQLEDSISPAPAVSQSPAPVVEHLSPVPAVFHAPTDLPARARAEVHVGVFKALSQDRVLQLIVEKSKLRCLGSRCGCGSGRRVWRGSG